MAIYDEVNAQLKQAMKDKDKPRLLGLRGIRAAFIEAIKEDGSDTLADDKALVILKRLAKQRRDSADTYKGAGRADLEAQERVELAVIEAFLPSLADEAQTSAWVDEAIAKTGASGMGDMGKVMGALMGAHRAELDGKLAQRIVRQKLG